MKFSEIYEGWRNKLFPPEKIKQLIADVAAGRLATCGDCPFHSKNGKSIRPDAHCTSCGCTLEAKVRCLSCKCPEGKWMPVVTREQEIEMNKDDE